MELIIPSIRIRIPTLASLARLGGLTAVAVALALCASGEGAQSAGTNSITSPDTAGSVGEYTSLALDNNGNPVVSYRDGTNSDLKVMHCNDINCAGGGESVTSPDTAGSVGFYTSLALDAAGWPVVSYFDLTNFDLKVLHCDDVNCAGGGESVTAPDTAGNVGWDTSLALDAAGRPVVSYWDGTNGGLKVLHCDDVNCAGGGESITSPDTAGGVGTATSLALDAAGRPVVSYWDQTNGDLKVMHCDDVDCFGGGESITSPDTAVYPGAGGTSTSLALDAAGRPVVSYYDLTNLDLKVVHCDDVNCAGGGESITSPDTAGNVGNTPSLALDVTGRPVVSYFDFTNGDLKVMRCDDVNCAGGGESITSPDTAGGLRTSLALDAAGRPVVSHQGSGATLKVLHCGTPACNNNPATQEIRITSLTAGWPAGPMGGACYTVVQFFGPTFVVCDNETGAGVDSSSPCTKDGSATCDDNDPATGSISVAVNANIYEVMVQSAPGHTPDPYLQLCAPSPGVDAKCSFTHTPRTRPWFPWDVNGDGAVAAGDINQVIGRFGQTK